MALCYSSPSSLGFESLHRPRSCYKVSVVVRVIKPIGHGLNLVPLRGRNFRRPSFITFAASQEESKPSDIDNVKEEDLKARSEELQESSERLIDTLKEQKLKLQNMVKEAYDAVYSEKDVTILKETLEKLKIQADKARQYLSISEKEVAEIKEYLAKAAENSPEEVKDIVQTFASSTDELNDVSKVRDFYVGIPYGAILCAGGFLSFMLTGSLSAVRFGIILGGILLAISISSLRSWRKGESSPFALEGQTAITTILFLRDLRLWSMRPFIAKLATTIISGAVVAFFVYRLLRDRGHTKGSNLEAGPEN